MVADVDGARLRRRGIRLPQKLQRVLLRPVGVALALLLAFVGGRWSVRHHRAHAADTPAVRDAAELERSLVDLEANLELGQAMVAHQGELQRRHERVSALACTALQNQHADQTRIATAKAKRMNGHALAHLTADEDDEEGETGAPTKPGPTLAARRVHPPAKVETP